MWQQQGRVSAQDLVEVLYHEVPRQAPIQLPGLEHTPHRWNRRRLGLDCDEVFPDIFIGDAATVRDKQYLKELRISHVVNCAEGRRSGQLDVSAWYYKDADIKYLGLPLEDLPSSNIEDYFHCTSQFIDCALFNGGRVFVNCMMGISRSATIVMAFLMLRRRMSAVEAVRTVRRRRDVWPNAGFLRKLADLDYHLQQQRGQYAGLQRSLPPSQQHPQQHRRLFMPTPFASIGAPMIQP